MKNTNEMVNSLLERREHYEAEQKKKRSIITRTVTSICCFCLVVLLGFGVWQSGLFRTTPPVILDGDNSTLQGTDKNDESKPNSNETVAPNDNPNNAVNTDKNYPDLTTLSLAQWLNNDDVVWMSGSPTKGNVSSGKHI